MFLWSKLASLMHLLTTSWTLRPVIRCPCFVMKRAVVALSICSRSFNQFSSAFFVALVRNILRSLLPLPITCNVSDDTCPTSRLVSSDSLNAQLRNIVMIQWFLAENSLAMSSLTLSSRVRYLGMRLGILGVSKSSATLLSMTRALFFRYFQNWRIDTIFLALVPALALLSVWQWEYWFILKTDPPLTVKIDPPWGERRE